MPSNRRKRFLFAALTTLVVLLVVEAVAHVLVGALTGTLFFVADFQRQRVALLPDSDNNRSDSATSNENSFSPNEVIHPYVGYVARPGSKFTSPISEFGYYDTQSPIQKREPGKLIVGVFGGSLAAQLMNQQRQHFADELQKLPEFASKKIVVLSLAMQGYKQPQQLLTLAYLLSQGAEFDLVINLDGFNEVALHAAENGAHGVTPDYPRAWYARVGRSSDLALGRMIGLREYLRNERVQIAEAHSQTPWRYSSLCNLVWLWRDLRCRAALKEADSAVRNYRFDDRSFEVSGPPFHADDPQAAYVRLVQTWKQSSLQMMRVCRENGIRYFQFLQPNQYVPESKPISTAEREIAVNVTHPYREGVEQGYPLLIAGGRELVNEGVSFTDLTQIFKTVEQPLYSDDCCHLNPTGQQMLLQKFVEVIASASASVEK